MRIVGHQRRRTLQVVATNWCAPWLRLGGLSSALAVAPIYALTKQTSQRRTNSLRDLEQLAQVELAAPELLVKRAQACTSQTGTCVAGSDSLSAPAVRNCSDTSGLAVLFQSNV